jgi:hypothetical protein
MEIIIFLFIFESIKIKLENENKIIDIIFSACFINNWI